MLSRLGGRVRSHPLGTIGSQSRKSSGLPVGVTVGWGVAITVPVGLGVDVPVGAAVWVMVTVGMVAVGV